MYHQSIDIAGFLYLQGKLKPPNFVTSFLSDSWRLPNTKKRDKFRCGINPIQAREVFRDHDPPNVFVHNS